MICEETYADGLFYRLGYRRTFPKVGDDNILVYSADMGNVEFDLKNRTVCIGNKVNADVIQAVYQKLEELGWFK